MIQLILYYHVQLPVGSVQVDPLQIVQYSLKTVTINERESLEEWFELTKLDLIESYKDSPDPEILLDIRYWGRWGTHNLDNTGTQSTQFCFVVIPYEREPIGGSWYKSTDINQEYKNSLFNTRIKSLQLDFNKIKTNFADEVL